MSRFFQCLLCALTISRYTEATPPPEIVAPVALFKNLHPGFSAAPLATSLVERMRKTTWHTGCPVPLEDLRALTISYWNFEKRPSTGTLIVHRAVAEEVESTFRQLFEHGFLIERMQPVEDFDGSDDRSMAANNTSAFNCRDVTGKPGRFSNHSWGRAIDINPLTNPMLLHGRFLPPEGARYADRTQASAGSILGGSFIVTLFQAAGWTWGGEWTDPDYQHFEKPAPNRDAERVPKLR